jgi:hypothetical protein
VKRKRERERGGKKEIMQFLNHILNDLFKELV